MLVMIFCKFALYVGGPRNLANVRQNVFYGHFPLVHKYRNKILALRGIGNLNQQMSKASD